METNLNKIEAREIMPGCHGKVIHGETINNKEAIANPKSLKFFENLPQLKL